MDIHGILWISNGLKGAISLAEEVNGAIMSYLLRPLFVQPLLGWMHLSSGLSCPKSIQRTSKNCNVKTCQDSVRQYSSCACDAASTQISHMYIVIILCVCTNSTQVYTFLQKQQSQFDSPTSCISFWLVRTGLVSQTLFQGTHGARPGPHGYSEAKEVHCQSPGPCRTEPYCQYLAYLSLT